MVTFLYIISLSLSFTAVGGDDCACATSNVHIRDGAGTNAEILTTLKNHHCVKFNGTRQIVNGDRWISVIYNGKFGWIHEAYVTISSCVTHAPSSLLQLPGCPNIVTRAEWGARAPTQYAGRLPATPKYMFLHHGASSPCFTKEKCIDKVQGYQNWHMDGHGWNDIGYSFVVGEDGNVYEGRGWDTIGAHTKHYNTVGLAICVIGDFSDHVPNQAALDAVQKMIACGVANNKLVSNYTMLGHRDVGSTACPGTAYYNLIQTWPHYNL
ncbi:peptidoglycan-recognition protein SC2-like isoform X1 [Mercenaria mercenaria]|uniref:peptidoglycan-recognition protein SC2-like isoform X1 n=1 Tax=Mercenaria mercenaria TaxID=6596 RepID=UPI00234FB2FB|nr:peptidoglycan-recognition protein SC2-like isoform X1 [Mercenaria mercenaria]